MRGSDGFTVTGTAPDDRDGEERIVIGECPGCGYGIHEGIRGFRYVGVLYCSQYCASTYGDQPAKEPVLFKSQAAD